MQVICVNSWGTGHFKVMVDTPAIPNIVTPVNPTWQVHKIQIKPKQIREEILSHTFTQTTGSFKLEYQVWNSYYAKFDFIQSSAFDVDTVTQDDLKGRVGQLHLINQYSPTVAWDSATRTLTLSFSKYRPVQTKVAIFDVASQTATNMETAQEHSAPLSGAYGLSIVDAAALAADPSAPRTPIKVWGGSGFDLADIAYNIDAWRLRDAIRNVIPGSEIEVIQVRGTSYYDEIELII